MAVVIAACKAPRGVVCMVLSFSTEFASCPSKAPITKTECVYPKDHPGNWHLGFTDDDFCSPLKWDADAIDTVTTRLRDG